MARVRKQSGAAWELGVGAGTLGALPLLPPGLRWGAGRGGLLRAGPGVSSPRSGVYRGCGEKWKPYSASLPVVKGLVVT